MPFHKLKRDKMIKVNDKLLISNTDFPQGGSIIRRCIESNDKFFSVERIRCEFHQDTKLSVGKPF